MNYRTGMGAEFDPGADLQTALTTAQNRVGTAGLFMAGLLLLVGFAIYSNVKGR